MSDALTRQQLLDSYASYGAPRSRWLVGGEYERAVLRPDGSPVRYDDPDGIRWILERYQALTGWKPKYEGENLIEVTEPETLAAITLEPGGQVELSGAPFRTLQELADELHGHCDRLKAISAGTDHVWTACGLTPIARITDIPFVPKGRYKVMREYLPAHGALAHWMMKGTCAVQANFDYEDEADCARKFHVSLDLGPLNTAIFANSPLSEGRPTGWQSFRGHIWTQTDPDRTGFPAALRAGYTHERQVDYLLDTPMMFIAPGGAWRPANGATFRTWMTKGIDGTFPTMADWALHQTSVFPEVRVKRTIEVRGADAVSTELCISFLALWKGILYGALDEARALADTMGGGDHAGRHVEAARHGLGASFGGRPAWAWAADLVEIARRGLVAIGEDTRHLDALAAQVATKESPAAAVLRAWERDPTPASILQAVAP